MKIVSSIKNVTFPISKLENDMFIIGIDNYFKLFDGKTIFGFNDIKIKEAGFKKIKNSLYFFIGKKIIKIDLQSLQSDVYLEYNSDELWLLNEQYFFFANRTKERREYKFELYSSAKKEVVWSNIDKLELTNLSNEYLIFSNLNRTVIARYRLIEGNKLWELDFSENRINGNVLLIENVLVFPTTSQILIGIEIETGKELWRVLNCNLYHQQQPNTNYLISLSANTFGDNFYQVIDPVNGKKLVDKKFDDFYYETQPTLACITATRYYFISNVVGNGFGTKSEQISHLGCINLTTHELEWIEKIGGSAYQKPEYHNDRFYLLDGEKTLHIYERDEIF